jgi:hypothetical protein
MWFCVSIVGPTINIIFQILASGLLISYDSGHTVKSLRSHLNITGGSTWTEIMEEQGCHLYFQDRSRGFLGEQFYWQWPVLEWFMSTSGHQASHVGKDQACQGSIHTNTIASTEFFNEMNRLGTAYFIFCKYPWALESVLKSIHSGHSKFG